MRSHGKKFKAAAAKTNATEAYASRAALEAVKAAAFAKFDETGVRLVRLAGLRRILRTATNGSDSLCEQPAAVW